MCCNQATLTIKAGNNGASMKLDFPQVSRWERGQAGEPERGVWVAMGGAAGGMAWGPLGPPWPPLTSTEEHSLCYLSLQPSFPSSENQALAPKRPCLLHALLGWALDRTKQQGRTLLHVCLR